MAKARHPAAEAFTFSLRANDPRLHQKRTGELSLVFGLSWPLTMCHPGCGGGFVTCIADLLTHGRYLNLPACLPACLPSHTGTLDTSMLLRRPRVSLQEMFLSWASKCGSRHLPLQWVIERPRRVTI
ncbi:hypothetical protein BJ170DRAFT_730396 [Xylariales sp. AK1849]|nr:hypothetical protein BJ170DRAFT_730396 [Xylariales sp. AK1849]